MAQDSFSQDAWTRARDRFVEDLSESEKAMYYQSSLETIFYDASAANIQHQAGSRSLEIVKRLQPLGSAIEQYGQALDVYANAYPLALSPLWGSLRIILHLASEFGKFFEKVVEMLERIGDVLPLFRSYELLFPNHERLVQKLSTVYVDILKFCCQAKIVFRRGRRPSMTNLQIFSRLIWKPFSSQFGDVLAKFRQHKESVEKEVQLAHMIESAELKALVLANTKQLVREKEENQRKDFFSRLTPIDHNAMHQRFEKLRCQGTCSWVLQERSYVEWTSLDGCQSLCLHGIPGSGKSVLTSAIIRHLQQTGKSPIFYHASYLDTRSLELRNVLGSLLKQVLDASLVSEDHVRELIRKSAKHNYNLEEDCMMEELRTVVEQNANLFCVIDGLEECRESDQRRMLETISLLSTNSFHVLLTCREEGRLWRFLSEWSDIRLDEQYLNDDIEAFTKSSVIKEVAAGNLTIGDEEQKNLVIAELVHKSHGMWVFASCLELCEATSPRMLSKILEYLPDGLNETYERILAKISEKKIHQDLAKKTFMWLACSRRPLRIEELQEAVAFDLNDDIWDAEKIPRRESILRACHGLVVIEDHVPCFAHHTIQQFLLQDVEQAPSTVKFQKLFSFSRLQAEEFAAEICVAYLNFSDFETAITHKPPEVQLAHIGILGPGGPGAIPSVLGLGKPIFSAAYRLMGPQSRATPLGIDYSQYLRIKPQAPKQWTDIKYALRGYAADHWIWHTKSIHDDTIFYDKFCLLVTSKNLSFDFRPWGANRHFGPYGCRSCSISGSDSVTVNDMPWTPILHWAAENGHEDVLRPILVRNRSTPTLVRDKSKYFDHERYSNESMFLACRHGQLDIVQWLIREGYPVESLSALLRAAITAKQLNVIQYLIHFRDINDEDVLFGLEETMHVKYHVSPIDQPSMRMVQVLLTTRPHLSFNCMILAIKYGYCDILRSLWNTFPPYLLSSQQPGNLWRTAVEFGQVPIIRALHETGVRIDIDPESGQSPLDLAIQLNRHKVLRCLLDLEVAPLSPRSFRYFIGSGSELLDIILEYDFGQEMCTLYAPCDDAVRTGNLRLINQLLLRELSRVTSIARHDYQIRNVELLVENGADVNQIIAHRTNRTPIFLLVDLPYRNQSDILVQVTSLKYLVKNGAELKHMDENNDTIYEVAKKREDLDLVEKLLEIERQQRNRPWLWKLDRHFRSSYCSGNHTFNLHTIDRGNEYDWGYLRDLTNKFRQTRLDRFCSLRFWSDLERDILYTRPELNDLRQFFFEMNDQSSKGVGNQGLDEAQGKVFENFSLNSER